jgi:hypothetical protein
LGLDETGIPTGAERLDETKLIRRNPELIVLTKLQEEVRKFVRERVNAKAIEEQVNVTDMRDCLSQDEFGRRVVSWMMAVYARPVMSAHENIKRREDTWTEGRETALTYLVQAFDELARIREAGQSGRWEC